jgi:hypothetical protein
MPRTAPTPEPRPALTYVGDGAAVPGVPTRDLSQSESESLHPDHYAEALASGLYIPVKEDADGHEPRP